jgi:hypothetical protein
MIRLKLFNFQWTTLHCFLQYVKVIDCIVCEMDCSCGIRVLLWVRKTRLFVMGEIWCEWNLDQWGVMTIKTP